jgi:D-methionine transport system substrate-binding protein
MKKVLVFALVLLTAFCVFAGGKKEAKSERTTLVIACTPEPHASMLNLVKDDLAAQGIDLVIQEYNEYNVENEAVESGEADANFFQHIPYMNSYISKGYHLVNAGGIHVEPLALYSKKYKSLSAIPAGATIGIPNDPTNEGRALLLLQSAGLIKLADSSNLEATELDIVSNPKNLKFHAVDAATLPRVLEDVDAAVINGNYAIPAGFNAAKDGLFVEGADSPYVNIVTVKSGRENDPAIKALVAALQSQKVKDWVAKTYPDGNVVTVF